MRKRFEQQPRLGAIAIADVDIDEKSRHELKHIFIGLKHIFTTPEVNEAVFQLLEEKIMSNNNHTGRPGMDLWHILVLGVTRLALDIDYDFLHDMANNHKRLRQIMGFGNDTDFAIEGAGYFHDQTIKDNLLLFDEELLMKISEIVVNSGHKLLKKKRKKF